MTEKEIKEQDNKYIHCSNCKSKYINDDSHSGFCVKQLISGLKYTDLKSHPLLNSNGIEFQTKVIILLNLSINF